MKSAGNVISAALAAGMLSLATVSTSTAADMADPMPAKAPVLMSAPAPAWSFEFTPYFWLSGLNGDTQVGQKAPITNIDLSFSDLIQHTGFAAMGTAELRYGKFGFVADMMYLSLAASATGPAGYVNAQLKDKTFIGTFNVAYRAIENGPFWVDLEAGVRAWTMNVDLAFDVAPLGASRTYGVNKSWVDPIIGIRARADLGSKFFVEGYADVGGFGVSSKSTWQVAGLLGYQYSSTLAFMAGYRYLAVDYNRDGFLWDVNMSGPILAINVRLN
jgi:hypothetical protein